MSPRVIDSATQLGEGSDGGFASGVMRWASAIDEFSDWMIAAGFAQTTRDQYRYQLRRLAQAYPRRSPWHLRSAQLVAWLAAQRWSPETRKSYRSTLRVFYRWGIEAGHTKTSPADMLRTIRVPAAMPRPTPAAVSANAFAAATDRDRLILSLAAYAGLRRAEIASLRWDHVDSAGARLLIKGKGGKVRAVPLHPRLATQLEAERARHAAGRHGSGYRYNGQVSAYVFPGQAGGHITPNALGKAASAALGDGWGLHSLRHQFATRAYAGSRDLLALQTLLGHSKPETTRRYTEVSDAALADVIAGI